MNMSVNVAATTYFWFGNRRSRFDVNNKHLELLSDFVWWPIFSVYHVSKRSPPHRKIWRLLESDFL